MSTVATYDRQQWYADLLGDYAAAERIAIQAEHELPPSAFDPRDFYTSFPVQIELGGRRYSFDIWRGQQLPDRLLAYDTETAAIKAGEIPQLALATVHGDQGSCYFIHASDLPRFVTQHAQAYWCAHNAVFDFWVTAQALQADPQACALWWDVAGSGRLLCTMLSDQLIRLGRIDAEPINRDLGAVASDYCPGVQLNKSDPYRLRYGELIGLPASAWADTELGFWTYAACDPIATLLVAQRQFAIASELIEPHRDQLLPEALRRFGPLTCSLQVQGAIALDYISRAGVEIDLPHAISLHHDTAELVRQHAAELEQLAADADVHTDSGRLFTDGRAIFKHTRAGELRRTQAGVPQRDAKAIKQLLHQIAQAADSPIRPPRNADGLVTDAVKYWKQHSDLHPFIDTYVRFSESAKLMQFFAKLDQQRIYPRYRPLVRTGRTSCSDPNLQQLPRDGRFREMIVAPLGHWLLQIDYSVLELRTLAQICLRRFGRSVLADLFLDGIDPHKYTASLLLGIPLEQFEQLPKAEQKQHRQRAKAINFGVPGGLGAASLVAYAKSSYGVAMTLEQARSFRQRLITQVYPELQAYLADDQQQDLADNLQCDLMAARPVFSTRDQISTAGRIISGYTETPAGSEYQPDLVQYVWHCLRQLNSDADLRADLAAQQPSSELMRRCFYGSAVTLSGRLRGHVGFAQRTNSPFQGLAADGNKLALFRLLRAGYQCCGFIHDEVLILIPDGSDYGAAVAQVQQILADAMQELTPDIPIGTEYLLADRWYKDAPDQATDEHGKLVPFRRPSTVQTVDQRQTGETDLTPQAARNN